MCHCMCVVIIAVCHCVCVCVCIVQAYVCDGITMYVSECGVGKWSTILETYKFDKRRTATGEMTVVR